MRPLFALFKRRGSGTAATRPQEDSPDPRAEELRRKLDESRILVGEREAFEAAEPTVDQTEHAPDDPERRRRDVHEAGRQVQREMRRSAS